MSGPGRHLCLSGPMGSGKSTVGRLLAHRLQRPFFDLDDVIASEAGQSIIEIFAAEGEAGFRARERRALASVLAAPTAVVALGGGTVAHAPSRAAVRASAHLVTLAAPAPVLRARLAGAHDRPLLAELEALLVARQAAYDDADGAVNTENLTPEGAADAVLARLGWRLEVPVELGARRYPVIVAWRAGGEWIDRIRGLAETGRVLLVTDDEVRSLYAEALAADLAAAGLAVTCLAVRPGEASKSLEQLRILYDEALAWGVDRGTLVVAMGGGVVGDLAGFLAATLLRGLPWVQLPTTLLAQVDSSTGGKTGINHPAGKNLIGAFHQPRAVLADTAWLASLPPRELRAGVAEVVKHAALADPGLLDVLPGALAALAAGNAAALVPLVARAIRVKAAVVAADEHEQGHRKVLNLGHTLAHALEAARPGALVHGEAVALGLAWDVERSQAHGLSPAEADRVVGALAAAGLDVDWRAWITPAVLDKVAKDKKIRREYIDDVVLAGLGRPVVLPVTLAAWREALARASVMVEA